ncbi:MAG: type II 3-dehydroquinate dehydratase [Opitutales bacterium]
MKTYGILHGPNLDRLGTREPSVYGSQSLADLEADLKANLKSREVALAFYQSNHEGALVDALWRWYDEGVAGVVLNPGALTHTSVALRDALSGTGLPAVEVHLSNVYRRESFRRHSYTTEVCLAVISGLHFEGYRAALNFLIARES